VNLNLAGSTLSQTFSIFKTLGTPGDLLYLDNESHASSDFSHDIEDFDLSKKNDNQYLLVIVESLGLFNEDSMNQLLFEPLMSSDLREKFEIKQGEVPFAGSTYAGEMRELCGIKTHFPFDVSQVKNCLPEKFKMKGYHTVSFHGYYGEFYYRKEWYPKIGFEESNFLNNLKEEFVRTCGMAFPGVCMEDMAQKVHQQLLAFDNKKQFVYWLTLQSHLPLDIRNSDSSHLNCGVSDMLRQNSDLCVWSRTLYKQFELIAQILKDPALQNIHVLLVGDHAPPFVSYETRKHFVEGKVPFIEFSPVSN